MKQLFTSMFAMAALATTALATDYNDMLTVTINGAATTPSENTITVDKVGDTYTLSLKNFVLSMGGETMPVGNIVLENVAATENNGVITLQTSQEITISAGDDPAYEGEWFGPMLSASGSLIPVNMVGEIRGEKFYTVINISFSGMEIGVVFGNGGYQIPNSDFELFHKATYKSNESDEPNSWHSFMSCTGSYASMVSATPHTFISTDVRPGTSGKSSVRLTSGIVSMLGGIIKVPANGTITTGRLKAGATTATDTQNCSFLDITTTDTDGNGDPFYTLINGRPDAIKVWLKYKQGQVNASNPYATISAVITDGTYYQDPEDKTYTNIVAKAQNATIASNDAEWQELTIPFDYASHAANNVEAKAILVTLSTNAAPGVASSDANNPDELYIDDLSLVYNAQLESLTLKGATVDGFDKNTYTYNLEAEGLISIDDIEAVADGQGACVTKQIEENADGVTVTITVTSNDLKTVNVYTVNIAGTYVTGIDRIETTVGKNTVEIYNINGQRVDNMSQKGMYILRQADGKAVKVLKK